MITRAVAKYLADELTDLTFTTNAATGNVWHGWFPLTQERGLAVIASGGGDTRSKAPTNLPAFQVLVRGEPDDYESGHDLAADVIDALSCLDAVTLDPAGDDEVFVIGISAVQSEPIPLGLDSDTRCFEFSVNFEARTYSPTTHRP